MRKAELTLLPLSAEEAPKAPRSPVASPTGIVRDGRDETQTLVVEPFFLCAHWLPPVGLPGVTSPGTDVLK